MIDDLVRMRQHRPEYCQTDRREGDFDDASVRRSLAPLYESPVLQLIDNAAHLGLFDDGVARDLADRYHLMDEQDLHDPELLPGNIERPQDVHKLEIQPIHQP